MEKMMQNKKVIKIICIVLAALLWIYVSYQENPSMTKTVRNVPVSISGEQTLKTNGFSVYSISETEVDVKATAKRLSLARINNKTLSASINVSSIKKEGTYTIPASVSSDLSSGGSFFAKGNGVTVVVEKILHRTRDINVNISAPTDPAVKLKSHTLSENKVKLSAPKSIMDKVGDIRTETVIPGSTGNSQTVQLLVYSKDGKLLDGVECQPSTVTVSYSLYDVKSVPITLKTTDGKSISLNSDYSLELYGTGEKFNKLKNVNTKPVDLSEYKIGDTFVVTLDIPDYAHLSSNSPNVTLTFEESFLENAD